MKFIEEIKSQTKIALIKKYNYLTGHLKPNDRFLFEQISESQEFSDDEFRLLKMKTELLYRNIFFEGDNADESDTLIEWE